MKFKRYAELRGVERRREVPVLVIGFIYVVWWSWLSERRFSSHGDKGSGPAGHLASGRGE
ncbi:hypothetical protein [Aquibium microcysteis]|uniref:hypothetical protein n=1 Tax=Aquibium microcysteis TaxID=675281 RepID=UPI001EF37306|nr:hypothetical protein [Aquibium microcysteis]